MIIVVKVVVVTLVVLFGIRFWMLIDDVKGLMRVKDWIDIEIAKEKREELVSEIIKECDGCEDCLKEQFGYMRY